MVGNEIEYIEPTQEHVGQMVEVRDDNHANWIEAKLTGILQDEFRFAVKRKLDGFSFAWRHARIPRPKPQPSQELATKPIDWTKPVRTKDGRAVRVLCTDGPGDYPVVGILDGVDGPECWHISGSYFESFGDDRDLENVHSRIQRDYWVNVYPDDMIAHNTELRAVKARGLSCLACVKITIDCEEGEGL